jgi:hypothetical protein
MMSFQSPVKPVMLKESKNKSRYAGRVVNTVRTARTVLLYAKGMKFGAIFGCCHFVIALYVEFVVENMASDVAL